MNASLARDLWLFAQLIFKSGMMTGLLPAIVLGVCYEVFFGRPMAKVIPFPRKPMGPAPRPAVRVVRKSVA